MSAADELRKLDAQINGIPGSQVRAKLVLDALPEIIAVVEAAERMAAAIETNSESGTPEWFGDPLEALSAKLES